MVVQGGCCLARGLRAGKSSADRIGRILSTPSKIDIFDVDRIGEAQSSMKRDTIPTTALADSAGLLLATARALHTVERRCPIME